MTDELFPTIETDEDIELFSEFDPEDVLLDAEPQIPIPYGFTWKFDFNKGDLYADKRGDFVVVSERDCLHEWAAHTLNTERFETPIFGGDIGTEINSYIGAKVVDGLVLAEIKQEIMEALLVHDRIDSVRVIAMFPLDHNIFAYFSYTTDDSLSTDEVVSF